MFVDDAGIQLTLRANIPNLNATAQRAIIKLAKLHHK